MHEENLNSTEDDSSDVEAYLSGFRPAEVVCSLEDTLYQAGWRAAVAKQPISRRISTSAHWKVFGSGVVCGMLPLLLVLLRAPDPAGSVRTDALNPAQPVVKFEPDLTPANSPADVLMSDELHSISRLPDYDLANSDQTVTGEFIWSLFPGEWLSGRHVIRMRKHDGLPLRLQPLSPSILWLAEIDESPSTGATPGPEVSGAEQPELLSPRSAAINRELLNELSL